MSGLIEETENNVTYLSIVNGKVTQRFKEHQTLNGKTVTKDRDIKDDDGNVVKTVIERQYFGIGGILEGIKAKDGNYGMTLELRIRTAQNLYNFSMKLDSSYGRSFMFRLNNIDPTKEIVLNPYNFEDSVKKNSKGEPARVIGISVLQKDRGFEKDKVPSFYTKEEPKGLPEWEQTTVAGQTKWNSDKQLDFLYKTTLEWADMNLDGLSVSDINLPQEKESKSTSAAVEMLKDAGMDEDPNKPDDFPF